MIPVVIAIVVGIAAALGGTALFWNDIVRAWSGKRLAVLGARLTGKTHLLNYITTGSIPAEYKAGVAPAKTTARRFQLKELGLKVREGLDVPGGTGFYDAWKLVHDQADIVFYLVRADRLIAGDADVEGRVRDDLEHIGVWLMARKHRPRFFFVGTHCDLDENFSGLSAKSMGQYVDKFRSLPVVTELVMRAGGFQHVKVVLGSMKTLEDTEALVYQILRQVEP